MRNRYHLAALLILVVDHVSKWIVETDFHAHQTVDIIPGYLCLSRVYNSGVAFGFFDNVISPWKPYILAAMAVLAIAVIFIYSMRIPRERKLLQVALAIIMGGILGNFVDRILRGYVVEFIYFHIHETVNRPTFNIADSAITIGIALLLIDTLKNPAAEKTAEQPAADTRL
jgi:signal peptidase II